MGRNKDRKIDRWQAAVRFKGGFNVCQGQRRQAECGQQRRVAGAGTGRRGAAVIVIRLALVVGAVAAAAMLLVCHGCRRRCLAGVADCGNRRQQDAQQGQQQQDAAQPGASMTELHSKTIHNRPVGCQPAFINCTTRGSIARTAKVVSSRRRVMRSGSSGCGQHAVSGPAGCRSPA